ncbi:MAG TPA: DUF2147 domain-containing protein [Caulobacteraceae bacterium]|jgi:uncharacterized protein (DUF2147 family)|nr:DUF2147 domain-containing protein [Caulobacteraceae bacterium]
MKTSVAMAIFTLALSAIADAASAAPRPDGLWAITENGKPLALIKVQTVGGQVQGALAGPLNGDSPNRVCDKCQGALRGQRITGMKVLWGLKPDPSDPLSYKDGSILDPDSGNTFTAMMTESADGKTLTVRGYMGVPALGRTQIWLRRG